jgi:hypothetical protein
VGFLDGRPAAPEAGAKRTALLGVTGFFQFFDVTFPDTEIEVTPKRNFPGRRGAWPPPADLWARAVRPG